MQQFHRFSLVANFLTRQGSRSPIGQLWPRMVKQWWRQIGAISLLSLVLILFSSGLLPSQAQAATTELYWYGHAAFRVTTPSGKVLLLDPWLENPMNPTGQSDLEQLDRADLILITHGHGDHVGNAIAIAQKTGAKLVSTFDLGNALVALSGYPAEQVGFDTLGNFGGELSLLDGEVRVLFVPAVHSSAIAADGSPAIYAGNPGGFLITVKNGPTIYHTGDTDVFSDMALIPKFHPIDVMLACIGDQFTMGPERAAEAVRLVKPKMVVPMHFGIFNLPGRPEAFAQALQKQGLNTQLKQMQVHETLSL